MALSLVTLVAITPQGAEATTWRVGDSDQPWRVYPVSFMLNAGEVYRPDYILGGAHAIEIIVDAVWRAVSILIRWIGWI